MIVLKNFVVIEAHSDGQSIPSPFDNADILELDVVNTRPGYAR